ncbi:MAG: hypothetical protein MJZ15_02515 [Bacteroidales bacterium]|nr:hypothetical protein [Bacteroidales bacterium]
MKNNKLFCAIASALMAMSIYSCKEDGPNQIPTIPTKFSIEDGVVVRDTIISLSASGSIVEDQSLDIYYHYYLGKSVDDMERVSGKVKLTPYTQYFWYVKVSTGDSYTESPIRTFYCVPDVDFGLSTDNGEGESSMIIKWNDKIDSKYSNFRLSVTADTIGFKSANVNVELPNGKTEYIIRQGDYDACWQDWDDKNGLYYEPILYTVKISADLQVGDKVCEAVQTAKGIFLDKDVQVRDAQFNVYRVKKIGNKTWMIDDLRYRDAYEYYNSNSSFYYYRPEGFTERPMPYSEESVLKSGQKGYLYPIFTLCSHLRSINKILPEGYELAKKEDWDDLLSAFGAQHIEELRYVSATNEVQIFALNYESKKEHRDRYNQLIYDTEYYKDQGVGTKLRSQYGWYSTEDCSEIIGEGSLFNAKPFGMISPDGINYSVNSAAFYYTYNPYICIVGVWTGNEGVAFLELDTGGVMSHYYERCSIRGVKKME